MSLQSFSGIGNPTLEEWLADFGNNFTAVQWDNLQKLVYEKQLLRGAV